MLTHGAFVKAVLQNELHVTIKRTASPPSKWALVCSHDSCYSLSLCGRLFHCKCSQIHPECSKNTSGTIVVLGCFSPARLCFLYYPLQGDSSEIWIGYTWTPNLFWTLHFLLSLFDHSSPTFYKAPIIWSSTRRCTYLIPTTKPPCDINCQTCVPSLSLSGTSSQAAGGVTKMEADSSFDPLQCLF